MKIILTGVGGFIGSCYLSYLNAQGLHDLIVVDADAKPNRYANLADKKFIEYLSRESLIHKLDQGHYQDVDGIVHLGACADTTMMDRQFLAMNNVEYSKHLAKWCLAGGKFFHYASSASVYGDGENGYSDADHLIYQFKPLNPYAESKWLFDRWLIQEKLTSNVVGFRYFNVFGPNEYHKGDMRSMVCKSYEQIRDTQKARLFATTRVGYLDGSEERDFVYIKDVCDMMFFFIRNLDKKGIFNIATGRARSFKDLVSAVFLSLKIPVAIDYISMPGKLRGQYQYYTQADMGKIKQAGYQGNTRSLEDSVHDYVTNYLAPGFKVY